MTTMLVALIVLVLIAWLGSLVIQLEREFTAARRRARTARQKERKLRTMIDRMSAEEEALARQVAHHAEIHADLTRLVKNARSAWIARQNTSRARLFLLNTRRRPGDRGWVVTLVNPVQQRLDTPPEYAREWSAGRDYLVFARTDHEARERAQRRFNARGGVTVKSCEPAPAGLLDIASLAPSPSTA